MYSAKGTTLSVGPGMYKIPSLHNIPQHFNVNLLRNAPNTKAVHSSKAVGEVGLVTMMGDVV